MPAHGGVLVAAVLALVSCSTITARTPEPAVAPSVETTHRLLMLPTIDDRSGDAAGKAIDVFGATDTVIRTDAHLPGWFDDAVPTRLAAEGIAVVRADDAAQTTLQLRLVSVSLRRVPGVVTARYEGKVELIAELGLADGAQRLEIIGEADREAVAPRAIEQREFDVLLASTLEAAAADAAAKVAAVVRRAPPGELTGATPPH